VPITLKTTAGTMTIQKTELADRWPADCSTTAPQTDPKRCFITVKEGFNLVLVYYTGVKLTKSDSDTAYVTVDDNTEQIKSELWGSSGEDEFFGFGVAVSAKRVFLHWPENPSVELPMSVRDTSIKATFTVPDGWHITSVGTDSKSGSFFTSTSDDLITAARSQRPPQLQPGQAVAQLIIYPYPAPFNMDQNQDPKNILRVLTSLDESAYKTTFGETQSSQIGSIPVARVDGQNGSSEVTYYGFFVDGHAAALIGMVAKGEKSANQAIFESIVSSTKLSK
jgi:hypothetical protein